MVVMTQVATVPRVKALAVPVTLTPVMMIPHGVKHHMAGISAEVEEMVVTTVLLTPTAKVLTKKAECF